MLRFYPKDHLIHVLNNIVYSFGKKVDLLISITKKTLKRIFIEFAQQSKTIASIPFPLFDSAINMGICCPFLFL